VVTPPCPTSLALRLQLHGLDCGHCASHPNSSRHRFVACGCCCKTGATCWISGSSGRNSGKPPPALLGLAVTERKQMIFHYYPDFLQVTVQVPVGEWVPDLESGQSFPAGAAFCGAGWWCHSHVSAGYPVPQPVADPDSERRIQKIR